MSRAKLYCGDALEILNTLPDASVQCCVTSPPYWGLRDYGVPGQLGLEQTPDKYVAKLVRIFAEVRRVLRADGTLWLNLGDSYASAWACSRRNVIGQPAPTAEQRQKRIPRVGQSGNKGNGGADFDGPHRWGGGDNAVAGLKEKDMIGIPWRVAFALQADGWWLRSDIIWAKPNPMPESVTDRPTKAHEYVFLLSKAERYYYDAAAIAEASVYGDHARNGTPDYEAQSPGQPVQSGITKRRRSVARGGFNGKTEAMPGRNAFRAFTETRNARTVWEIATQPYSEAHFATFPEELARRCVLAGSRPGDTVLDPFGGSGTVAQVATGNGRDSLYIDLNPKYLELARQRIGPMLCDVIELVGTRP